MAHFVLALLVITLACLTQSMVGVGCALLAMPALVPLPGLSVAAPVVGLFSLALGLLVLLMDQAQVDLRSAKWLIAGSLVGVPFGLLLLRVMPEPLMKVGLGTLLISYGIYSLSRARLPWSNSNLLALAFGFGSGVLGGAYNTNAPPLMIYGTLRRWPPAQFRATLQGVFAFANLAIAAGQRLSGLWTPEVLQLFAFSVPLTVAAVLNGRRILHELFGRLVYVLIIALGATMLLSGVAGF